jgi:capsular polysaccharide export protein
MIRDGLNEFGSKRVLMLQGPVGPFFSRLATDLALVGATVFKVNFNGGDWLFSRNARFAEVFNFRGSHAEWPAYVDDLLVRLNVEMVFLFGDCRPMHVAALGRAQQRGIHVGVFEEGYLRPDYITLERDGVNNNSSLPSDPRFYLKQPTQVPPPARPLGSTRTCSLTALRRRKRPRTNSRRTFAPIAIACCLGWLMRRGRGRAARKEPTTRALCPS